MGQTYRLVGSQDPSSRIDRVVVEEPSADNPEGTVLELGGAAVELSNEQVLNLSSVVKLEHVDLEVGEEYAEFGPENYPDDDDTPKSKRPKAPSATAAVQQITANQEGA